jgi:holliday junction DNA helicase RuvA
MIALLRGEVAVRRTDHVVILCAGVGYRAAVSAETLRHVPAVGEQATLHGHLIVRDDALALYGFYSEEERDLFLMLLSVQAVGPKVALAVLSIPGRAGYRQADRRADHRGAAREGGGRRRRGRRLR